MNRLSYLYTRARGQHTQWHPSSLSNPAHKDTAYSDSSVANTHRHAALIFSAPRSAWQTQQDAHAFTKTSQCLTQLVNAGGKAEVIISSVFNSSVTGGRSISVNKEHVNKMNELFTGQRLARTHWSASCSPFQPVRDHLRKGRKKKNFLGPGVNTKNRSDREASFIIKCKRIHV